MADVINNNRTQARKEWLNRVTAALTANGLLVKDIPTTVLRESMRYNIDELLTRSQNHGLTAAQRKKALVAMSYREAVQGLFDRTNHLCQGLGGVFKKQVLGLHADGLLRTDQKVVLAYHMIGKGPHARYDLVGVASYGASDEHDCTWNITQFDDNAITQLMQQERLVEVDLICAKPENFAYADDPAPRRNQQPQRPRV